MAYPVMRACQIYNGLGAGNIGDELMARAFWSHLPPWLHLDVPLAPESAGQSDPYPAPHRYLPLAPEALDPTLPGLLVGATPATEAEGLDWPLRYLAPGMLAYHRGDRPVDALGVGVEAVASAAGRALFREAFLPVRSWTVRSPDCVRALVDLGVDPARIRLGADWAWLYPRRRRLRQWAEAVWRIAGIDPDRPLLVANVMGLFWRENVDARRATAAALALAAHRFDLQLAFFCNESRPGAIYDFEEARAIAALTGERCAIVPNRYYSPDEALSLLARATVTVGLRYHFVLESVLAGTVPVGILRGQKMRGLAAEIPFPVGGTVTEVDRDVLLAAMGSALENRAEKLAHLNRQRQAMTLRATNNLSFLEELPPYCRVRRWGAGC